MDKIVILAKHPEDVALLRACYAMLFPECELQIIQKPAEGTDDASAAGDPAASEDLVS